MGRTDLIETGRRALARGAWQEALACFERAVGEHASAEGWEGLAWAAWWLEDGGRALEAREQAFRRYKSAGDLRGAARAAIWLANDYIEFRGEDVVAGGWFARCERILEEIEPSPEHGWLAALRADHALASGDTATARRLGAQARDLGRTWGLTALEMVGLATEGLALVSEGAVERGMRCLDEATAAALGGEFEELAPVCWTCCNLIYACERIRDFDRAGQWCRRVEEFTARMRIQFVNGVCRAHYAAVLTWHGDWAGAEGVLVEAIRSLSAIRPFWVPEATVRLAELRRRQGRSAEADRLFAEAEDHPLAALGRAELCLDRGEVDGAAAIAERLLRQLPTENRTQRAAALEVAIRACAANGEAAAAAVHLAELQAIVAVVHTEPLQAALRLCEGHLARASGDLATAQARFEDAVTLFRAAGAPFEAGNARIELADSLLARGRPDAAAREAEAAGKQLAELGADAAADTARALLHRVRAGDRGGRLTEREVQVLRLVAEGRTDRQIAAAMVLSQHTVHRHVANIYTKLDCSTRAAAVTKAGRLGLL